MFEYFMFSFASSVAQGSGERATGVASAAESTGGQYLSKLSRELQIGFKNPLSTKADNMQSFSALYLQLVTMYIKYFIPLVPQPSTLTAASADTVITSLDSLASNPSQRFIILSMSEALGVILSDQWITQGYRVAEDRYERPSSLRIKCIHTLVAHLSKSNLQDIFTGLPLHDVSPWVDQPVEVIIQRRVISSLQKKLFHFFHNSLEFWPIDEGYSSVRFVICDQRPRLHPIML
ncbi:uncharacterized protein BJ171DRAFT_184346 [Polychytrium aggregatum]|uniref:uncharacterized protein n=1 Tax=Polychytrium aggregatum TaxID=110093 RepID=UPI0022FE2860|nr:uncharacterized protein BJ171DRAFT_184346 [Polychytrium aggregatum]KAI9202397.1 hypothetical protein BJ171DRAFT_184346 [Polychytrium aggregatum]